MVPFWKVQWFNGGLAPSVGQVVSFSFLDSLPFSYPENKLNKSEG